MPHIRVRAMTDSDLKKLSQKLVKELSVIMNSAEENFTLEKIETVFYRDGAVKPFDQCDPMVEVHWFDRGPEIKSAAAKTITELVRECSKSEFIAVVFFDLSRENYFENGVHF